MKLLRWKPAALVALLLGGAACTPLIDHSAVQCQVDADCAHFHGHPFCMKGLCVPSGFAPEECFYSTPANPGDFLNFCSTSYLSSDDESAPGVCASPGDPEDTTLKDPPPLVPGTASGSPPPVPTVYCKDMAPAGGSVLYMSGSSNFKPLLEKLAPYIVDQGLTPVFKVTTSCTGVRSMNPRVATYQADHSIRDPAAGSADTYAQFYTGGDPVNCLLGPGGVAVDVGESEIYPDTCGVAPNNDDVAESPGPILPIVMVVPRRSHERSISAATARRVFGGGGLAPWDDPKRLFIRGGGTATLRLIGLAIGVGPTGFWGIDQGSAEAMAGNLRAVTLQAEADKALGMIGTDLYDEDRLSLKALGFKATGQTCAYLPDSSLTSRDKINVRDGHYPIWGRLHFFRALVNSLPVSEAATKFTNLFTLPSVPEPMLDAFIDSSFVPECAMKISVTTELGPPVNEGPAVSCGCYFDDRINQDKTKLPPGCKRCQSNGECPEAKPSCNYGFCEAIKG